MNSMKVGPVLVSGPVGQAVAAAIVAANANVEVIDRGSYLRVIASGSVSVARAAIEEQLGSSFRLPGDLETVMSSFQGRFSVDEERATWSPS